MANSEEMIPAEKLAANMALKSPPPTLDGNAIAERHGEIPGNTKANTTSTNTTSTTGKKSKTNGKGLSELARQLRVMQAKNSTLSAEIQRLERQLRILADTSGVSVSDLRGTLQRACESEAYAELQTQLTKLQYQLEEAQLRKAVDFDREAEGKKTANLQLRIGELEESEEALRKEIQQLYQSQDLQAEEAIKLKKLNERQENEIKALKAQLEGKEKERPTADRSAVVVVSPTLPKKKASSSKEITPNGTPDPTTKKYEENSLLEDNQLQLLRKQVAARGKELELKESQYKTRFTLQEERIVDMEQQLSSLYTAFELIDQEHSQEKQSKEALTRALRLADAQVAKAVDHLQRSSPTANPQSATTAAATGPSANASDAFVQSNSGYSPASYATTPSPVAKSTALPASSASTKTGVNEVIFSGPVMKRGRLNRWKQQHASLLRGFATFQLHLSDSSPTLGHSKKPSVYSLVVFRSNYEVVKTFPNFPFAFRIKIDKFNRNSPEVVLAVKTEAEFNQWIVGLHEAVNGGGQVAKRPPTSPPPVFTPKRIPQQPMVTVQQLPTEDSALAAALEESLRVSEAESAARAASVHGSGQTESGISPTSDSDLDAALAESLRVSEQEHAMRGTVRDQDTEETKQEIGESESSDADLKAAVAESLRVAQKSK
jgi:hypothetical protein